MGLHIYEDINGDLRVTNDITPTKEMMEGMDILFRFLGSLLPALIQITPLVILWCIFLGKEYVYIATIVSTISLSLVSRRVRNTLVALIVPFLAIAGIVLIIAVIIGIIYGIMHFNLWFNKGV